MKGSFDKYFLLGIIFLSMQVISIIYSQFIPERFFCWRPYDNHTHYEIRVEIDGTTLNDQQIKERYRYRSKGWEPRSVNNIISIIDQYERTYGKLENAKVQMTYSTNGRPEETWILDN